MRPFLWLEIFSEAKMHFLHVNLVFFVSLILILYQFKRAHAQTIQLAYNNTGSYVFATSTFPPSQLTREMCTLKTVSEYFVSFNSKWILKILNRNLERIDRSLRKLYIGEAHRTNRRWIFINTFSLQFKIECGFADREKSGHFIAWSFVIVRWLLW